MSVEQHDCLDRSGVIVCGKTEPHHNYRWMDRPVTQGEIEDFEISGRRRENPKPRTLRDLTIRTPTRKGVC